MFREIGIFLRLCPVTSLYSLAIKNNRPYSSLFKFENDRNRSIPLESRAGILQPFCCLRNYWCDRQLPDIHGNGKDKVSFR